MSIRVFLLDDHGLVREGIRQLLETDEEIEVVGEATTVAEALLRIPLANPDVAILDVRLEDGSGIEVCRDMRSALPDLVCLMLTSYADDEALYASVMAGASGYVLKRIRAGELIEDVKKVADGASLMDPRTVARVVERIRKGPEEDPDSRPHPSGTADIGPHSGRAHQSPDRHTNDPRRKDGQELHHRPAGQAQDDQPHGGRDLRRPPRREIRSA